MKKFLLPLILLFAPTAALAGGGPPAPSSGFKPQHARTVLFAFLPSHSNFNRNRRAQQYTDYMNWLIEQHSVNVKIIQSVAVLPSNMYGDAVYESANSQYLDQLRAANRVDTVMVMNPASHGVLGKCGHQVRFCWASLAGPLLSGNQIVAHEMGHWFGISHWYGHPWNPTGKAYAAGYGTWAWVDLMHYPGTNGKGVITKDAWSDHEISCDSFYRCGDWTWGSGARHLREHFGRYQQGHTHVSVGFWRP